MGAAAAVRLHEDGYELVLADLSRLKLTELAARLSAEAVEVDVTEEDAVAALVVRCRAGVDALVITAGLSMSMAPFERIMDVNLGGTARTLRLFGPVMRQGGAGVCFASMAGHLCGPIDSRLESVLADTASSDLGRRAREALPQEQRVSGMAYGLSKLGIIKLVQRTCAEWGRNGARVCSVSPGCIDTPMGTLERKASP
jgi:NAD(P)-dependent dehydrogenase (short-subunit alcohol dehydrogenase family)